MSYEYHDDIWRIETARKHVSYSSMSRCTGSVAAADGESKVQRRTVGAMPKTGSARQAQPEVAVLDQTLNYLFDGDEYVLRPNMDRLRH